MHVGCIFKFEGVFFVRVSGWVKNTLQVNWLTAFNYFSVFQLHQKEENLYWIDNSIWVFFFLVNYYECVHVCQLIFRFFNLTDNPSFARQRTCLIHKFAINHSIINLVFLSDFIKLIYPIWCFFTEIVILLELDDVASTIFFALVVKSRCCKTAIVTKQELDGWIII